MSKVFVAVVGAGLLVTTFTVHSENVFTTCGDYKSWVNQEYGKNQKDVETYLSHSSLSHTLVWENDAFAQGGDRHYTNGMKLSWIHNPCRHAIWEKFIPAYAALTRPFLKWAMGDNEKQKASSGDSLIGSSAGASAFGISTGGLFGMNMYTPEIITPSRQRLEDPVVRRELDDRPYVGWLYVGVSYQAVVAPRDTIRDGIFVRGSTLIATEFQVGVIGPAAGQEYVQTYVHKELGMSKNIPQGWEYQLENQLGWDVTTAARHNWFVSDGYIRVTPMAGFSVGNVAQFVNAGGSIAFGLPWIGRPADDFVFTTIQPTKRYLGFQARQPKPAMREGRGWIKNFEILLGYDRRFIRKSIFIQGTGEARHDIYLRHSVYDQIFGMAVSFRGCDCSISFRQIKRSSEFNKPGGVPANSHKIGQWSIDWKF